MDSLNFFELNLNTTDTDFSWLMKTNSLVKYSSEVNKIGSLTKWDVHVTVYDLCSF